MAEKVIKEVIAYYCDECGGFVKYSGNNETIGNKTVYIHYCTECQHKYDFDNIYPIYENLI